MLAGYKVENNRKHGTTSAFWQPKSPLGAAGFRQGYSLPQDFLVKFPASESVHFLSWSLKQRSPEKAARFSVSLCGALLNLVWEKKNAPRKSWDNMPDHCCNVLVFGVALPGCFLACNYACSKMFVIIWKCIKPDTCWPKNMSAGVSCPCFVVLGQYVGNIRSRSPNMSPIDGQIHYTFPNLLFSL